MITGYRSDIGTTPVHLLNNNTELQPMCDSSYNDISCVVYSTRVDPLGYWERHICNDCRKLIIDIEFRDKLIADGPPNMHGMLNRFARFQHAWVDSVDWVESSTTLEKLALLCSEVGEAINECRGNEPTEQFGVELADVILRVLAVAEEHKIDIESSMIQKALLNLETGNKGRVK